MTVKHSQTPTRIHVNGVYIQYRYSCRDALSVRAYARCAWLRVGDYLYLQVTRESLASDSRVTRKLRAILRDHLANAQNHLSNARCESDMPNLFNLNNLARKVCCKKNVSCSCPLDVNIYVKFDCSDYCLVPPSIHT